MVAVHPFFVLGLLFVLAVIAAIVVGVVVVVSRSTATAPRPAPPTQLSPDGKWWWDGREWKPVQPPGMPPPS